MPMKNREWNAPPALPADDSQPEPLQREAKRLNDANAKVAELRVAADALDKKTTVAYAHDKRTDRRPFFQSVLAALRAELEISEAIAICYAAVQRHRQAAHVDAEAKLREAVENVRKKLCIPAAIEFVPLACLQKFAASGGKRKPSSIRFRRRPWARAHTFRRRRRRSSATLPSTRR